MQCSEIRATVKEESLSVVTIGSVHVRRVQNAHLQPEVISRSEAAYIDGGDDCDSD
jgi:hypothetical protein